MAELVYVGWSAGFFPLAGYHTSSMAGMLERVKQPEFQSSRRLPANVVSEDGWRQTGEGGILFSFEADFAGG